MKLLKKSLLIIPIVFFIGLMPLVGHAEDMAYSVKANLPENQRETGNTFFDLLVKPEQTQELSITITSGSDKEETYTITPNIATTNNNGVIEYSQTPNKKDSSLKVPFTDLISEKQEITLAPTESKEVKFTLKMPKKPIEGVVLGGFYIQKKDDENQGKTDRKVMIENKYAYVIGARLIESEKESEPKLAINDITPGLINYRTAVSVNLQNTAPRIIKGLSVDGYVTEKGSTEVLHQTKKDDLMMAPNSNFDYAVLWDKQELKPGKYTMHVKASIKELSYEESFEKNFEIDAKEAKEANKEAVELEKGPDYQFYILIGVAIFGVLLLVGLLVYLVRKNKKKQEKERHKLARKHKKKN